jgi:APA family basic amino acid/polyamine antiporter
MLTKLGAIAMLVGCGWMMVAPANVSSAVAAPVESNSWQGLAAAMVPVLFAYGGWQTASFVSGEMRDPRRDLPRGLFIGVAGVIVVYVGHLCLPASAGRFRWPAPRRRRPKSCDKPRLSRGKG